MPRWHFGKKFAAGKRPLWTSAWLEHRCADLALAFEVGVRAYHHEEER